MSSPADIEVAIEKDVRYSVLIGPTRVIVPIAGYAVLYPLILRRFGAEVLGIWALMSALPYAMSILEVGLGEFILRDVAKASGDALSEVKIKYRIARLFYIVIGLVLSLLALPIGYFFVHATDAPYDHLVLTISVSVLIVAIFTQFVVKLEAAILSGKNQNYFTHIAMGLAPIVFFAVAIFGAVLDRPIEGLVLGNLLTQLLLIVYLRRRQLAYVPDWSSEKSVIPKEEVVGILSSLIKEGWHLYSMSIGLLLREPVLRFSVAAILGLKVSAVYEIAMRVARAPRDLFTAGFGSLFASFTVLLRENNRSQVIALSRRSLIMLLTGGGVALALVAASLPVIFTYWLGEYDAALLAATRILIIWCLITLLNVPFWYILLASHNEKTAARSVWLHLGLMTLIYPFSHLLPVSLDNALIYWVATSLLTQVVIYYGVHRQARLLLPIVTSAPLLTALAIALLMTWVQFGWSLEATGLPVRALLVAVVSAVALLTCFYWESRRSWRA